MCETNSVFFLALRKNAFNSLHYIDGLVISVQDGRMCSNYQD